MDDRLTLIHRVRNVAGLNGDTRVNDDDINLFLDREEEVLMREYNTDLRQSDPVFEAAMVLGAAHWAAAKANLPNQDIIYRRYREKRQELACLVYRDTPPNPVPEGKSLPEVLAEPDEDDAMYEAMEDDRLRNEEIRNINAAIAVRGYGYVWCWVDHNDLLRGIQLLPPDVAGFDTSIVPYNGAEPEKHLSEGWYCSLPNYCEDKVLAVDLFLDGRERFGDAFVSGYDGDGVGPDDEYGGVPMYAAGFKGGEDQYPYPFAEAIARAFVSALNEEKTKRVNGAVLTGKTEEESRREEAVSNRPSDPGSFSPNRMKASDFAALAEMAAQWKYETDKAEKPKPILEAGTLMVLDAEGNAVPAKPGKNAADPDVIGKYIRMTRPGKALVQRIENPQAAYVFKTYALDRKERDKELANVRKEGTQEKVARLLPGVIPPKTE